MTTPVRTRIAPSPTGLLHVGNARTALFNWLFARKHGGQFIVRVEDTDVERSKPEFERDALINFQWLGLEWDEGPLITTSLRAPRSGAWQSRTISNHEIALFPPSPTATEDPRNDGKGSDEVGDYGPYRQSRRGEIYRRYLEELYEEDHLYHCFCAPEELEAMRQDQLARGEAPRYIGRCRDLPKDDVEARKSRGDHSVLRFVMPARKLLVRDIIRGTVEFDTGLMGDTVVARDFTHPLFHFAVVVDDFTMEISHVIRGEDHIPNTPLHMLLQEALGFPTPQYAHIPLILGPDRAKLSKRHGATAVTEYRKQGYLPEAMVNFLALLGWHPADDKEILSKGELIEQFSLERIQKSAAIFNVEKLNWLNGSYMRTMSVEELGARFDSFLGEKDEASPPGETLVPSIATVRERAKTLRDIQELTAFYFVEPSYPKKLLRWNEMDDEQIAQSLEYARELLEKLDDAHFTKEDLEKVLIAKAAEWGRGDRGKLLWPLRVALSGREASPGPFEIAGVLGKKETLNRIEKAISLVKQP